LVSTHWIGKRLLVSNKFETLKCLCILVDKLKKQKDYCVNVMVRYLCKKKLKNLIPQAGGT